MIPIGEAVAAQEADSPGRATTMTGVVEAPLKGQLPQAPPPSPSSTKRKCCYGLLAAVVVAIVVAVPVTVTQFSVHSRSSTLGTSPVGSSSGTNVLTQQYCSKLKGDPKTYCNSYLKATGPNKFMAASIWLQVSQATRKWPDHAAPSVPHIGWVTAHWLGHGRLAGAQLQQLLLSARFMHGAPSLTHESVHVPVLQMCELALMCHA